MRFLAVAQVRPNSCSMTWYSCPLPVDKAASVIQLLQCSQQDCLERPFRLNAPSENMKLIAISTKDSLPTFAGDKHAAVFLQLVVIYV